MVKQTSLTHSQKANVKKRFIFLSSTSVQPQKNKTHPLAYFILMELQSKLVITDRSPDELKTNEKGKKERDAKKDEWVTRTILRKTILNRYSKYQQKQEEEKGEKLPKGFRGFKRCFVIALSEYHKLSNKKMHQVFEFYQKDNRKYIGVKWNNDQQSVSETLHKAELNFKRRSKYELEKIWREEESISSDNTQSLEDLMQAQVAEMQKERHSKEQTPPQQTTKQSVNSNIKNNPNSVTLLELPVNSFEIIEKIAQRYNTNIRQKRKRRKNQKQSEESHSLHYATIHKSKWTKEAIQFKPKVQNFGVCDCKHSCDLGDCINERMCVECTSDCKVSECKNQRISNLENATENLLYIKQVKCCGFGAFAISDIPKHNIITEYVGEIITKTQCQDRLLEMNQKKERNFYFLALGGQLIVDATSMGNKSRFINHSCDPNSEATVWDVKGEKRIGIFALKNIAKNSQITFDYNFEEFGIGLTVTFICLFVCFIFDVSICLFVILKKTHTNPAMFLWFKQLSWFYWKKQITQKNSTNVSNSQFD